MQWKQLPIDKGANGKAEIHYAGIFKLLSRWAEDGSLEQAFIAAVQYLADEEKLNLSVLHGDSSNTVAKKGKTQSAAAERRTQTLM
jgi:hypothetical protein